MLLLFSNLVFKEETMRALSWTLLHSLWLGMVLSVIAGTIVFFTKKTSPSLRYNLLTGSLLGFLFSVAVTYNNQVIKAKQFTNAVHSMPAVQINTIEPAISPVVVESVVSIPAEAVGFINANGSWIVLTWLLMIGFQFIRLAAGLYGVYHLRSRQTFSPGGYWNERITELSRQLQINKQVRLLQSGIARVPAVIGCFKPVILFPAAMLASLPANEVEAILIHELAHIRRKDFLANLLQHIAEIIFFFNPAVLWVSSLIKLERESCCDDIAVSQTDSKRNYIKALMSFQGFDLELTSPIANGFAGEKKHLIYRVKRIIYNSNKTLNNMEKKFLVAGIILTSVFIFAFSSNSVQQNGRSKGYVSQSAKTSIPEKAIDNLPVNIDTVPAPYPGSAGIFNGKITTSVKGKKYTIVYNNNQVTELYVEGKRIPDRNIADYKIITDEIIEEAKSDAEQSQRDMEESAIELEQSKRELEESHNELEESRHEMEHDKKQIDEEREQNRKEMEQSKLEMQQSDMEMEQSGREIEREMEQSRLDMEQSKREMKKEMEQSKLEMEQSKRQMKQEMEQSNRDMEQSKRQMKQEMQQSKLEMAQSKTQAAQSGKEMEEARREVEQSKKDMEQSKKLQEGIVGDLIKERLVKNKNEVSSYKLSDEELIVNGVKQPDAVHKRFRDKYVKSKNWTIEYNNNNDEQ